MHDRDVVHLGNCCIEPIIHSQSFLDIKPDNIMAKCCEDIQETIIEKVQITDLENAACLPKGRCIKSNASQQ